ncbi:MAG: ATP-binding protein [Alcanivorax sp.]
MTKTSDLRYKRKRKGIKKFLPETLFFRSLLILITPIFLIQIILTVVFFDRHWSRMTSRLSYAVAGEISIVLDYIENSDTPEDVDHILNLMSQRLNLLITHDDGAVLDVGQGHMTVPGYSWEAMIKNTLSHELHVLISEPYTVSVDFAEKWIEVRVQTSKGILNVSIPERRLFSSTTYIFLLWVFGASSVLLVIAVLFMRNQIRPIRRLSIAAEHFGKGRNVNSFKIEGAREVRQAGQAFVDMKTRIQRQISQRTDMLAGVSHDLRTPLTRLKLQVSMMGDSPDIYEMKKDINDMEKMIEGYLSFVRGEGREKSKITEVAAVLREVTTSAKRQGCDVDLVLNDVTNSVMLRPVAFKRCLLNIVSNAIKYADHLWITLDKKSDNELEIIIEDNGPGIDEEQYEKVFRPFYRVEGSRNPDTGGVGLGLPIAMDIIHAHGGEIWLQKSRHGGVAVHITLPI